jgi:hypothetical protein
MLSKECGNLTGDIPFVEGISHGPQALVPSGRSALRIDQRAQGAPELWLSQPFADPGRTTAAEKHLAP